MQPQTEVHTYSVDCHYFSLSLGSAEDAVQAKVIVDLRQSGLSFDRLQQAATQLDGHPKALTDGAMVLVDGSVSVVDQDEAAAAIQKESLTLVYNTTHAVQLVHSELQ